MKIVFFDLETTGTDPGKHKIIQIAAVATDGFRVVGTFERKLKFDVQKADPVALEINCYDPQTWEAEAVDSRDALATFTAWLKPYKDVTRIAKASGRPFKTVRMAGHNIVKFDLPFLQAWYKGHGQFCPADFLGLDTLQLVMWRDVRDGFGLKDFRLETVCQHFGVRLDGAHDALADITANVEAAKHLLNLKTGE